MTNKEQWDSLTHDQKMVVIRVEGLAKETIAGHRDWKHFRLWVERTFEDYDSKQRETTKTP